MPTHFREKDKNVHYPTVSSCALREIADAIRQERKNKAEKEEEASSYIVQTSCEVLYKYTLISV